MSKVNQGVREMFKEKQDWMDKRLRPLNRPQNPPTLNRPAADRKEESLRIETDGKNQGEI